MTKDEALKMAFDKIIELSSNINYEFNGVEELRECDKDVAKAIAEALAQPQPRMFLDLSNSNGNHPIEQPSQEPFGYWHVGETEDESDFFLFKDSGDVACDNCIKLYTSPPSCQECENLKHDLEGYMDANKALINREWQGLSDDETENILDKLHYDVYPVRNLANAIEQALKEKNT